MNMPTTCLGALAGAMAIWGLSFTSATPAMAQASKPSPPTSAEAPGYSDTPRQPNGRWRVHDSQRPRPESVPPARPPRGRVLAAPPSDAIVLLDRDTSAWQPVNGEGPIPWKFRRGVLTAGDGNIRTRQEFEDFQLHIEWAVPRKPTGTGQGRGNSGVFLLGAFEIQILDSHENVTYADGQAAALYGQYPPLVNAARGPGRWQSYDIIFEAPDFENGKLKRPAVVTVIHNGLVVQHATPFYGPTAHKKIPPYTGDVARGPIVLQDHGAPVQFRNIWIRPIKPLAERE